MAKNNVLGIETSKYTKICYILVLIASGSGLISNLFALINLNISGGIIAALLGLLGIALAATAYVAFRSKFSGVDNSHFLFLIVLFIAFFILLWVIGSLFVYIGVLGSIFLFLLSAFQFTLLFAGFKVRQRGQAATKDNLINGLKSLISKFKS